MVHGPHVQIHLLSFIVMHLIVTHEQITITKKNPLINFF